MAAPLKQEVEGDDDETERLREENDYFDKQVCVKTGRAPISASPFPSFHGCLTQVGDTKRSEEIERKYTANPTDSPADRFGRLYRRRLEYRCQVCTSPLRLGLTMGRCGCYPASYPIPQGLLTRAAEKCRSTFQKSYDKCYDKVTFLAAWLLCWPMKLTLICSIVSVRPSRRIATAQAPKANAKPKPKPKPKSKAKPKARPTRRRHA